MLCSQCRIFKFRSQNWQKRRQSFGHSRSAQPSDCDREQAPSHRFTSGKEDREQAPSHRFTSGIEDREQAPSHGFTSGKEDRGKIIYLSHHDITSLGFQPAVSGMNAWKVKDLQSQPEP